MTMQQQINAMAVQAAAYSAYAAAMGIAISTMGMALDVPVHPDVIRDLRHAFGTRIVDAAIKTVGTENVHALAKEINRLFEEDLRKRYGDHIATTALAAAPPGEMQKVEDIARILSGKGITPATPPAVQTQATETAKRRAARKHPAKPLKDTKTGIVYPSMHKAYVAVAREYGLDPKESWGIYGLMKDHPKRFKKVSLDEYKRYVEAHPG